MVSRSNIRIRGEVLKALALSSLDSGDSGNSGTLFWECIGNSDSWTHIAVTHMESSSWSPGYGES